MVDWITDEMVAIAVMAACEEHSASMGEPCAEDCTGRLPECKTCSIAEDAYLFRYALEAVAPMICAAALEDAVRILEKIKYARCEDGAEIQLDS